MTRNISRYGFREIAMVASAVVALAGCSKNGNEAPATTTAASAPTSVAATTVAAPVGAPPSSATTSAVATSNNAYEAGRRDQQRQDAYQKRSARSDHESRPTTRNENQQRRHDPQVTAASCQNCGVVESIDAVQIHGQTNGAGAVAGGVGGALVGNRIAGDHNRTLGGVIGAVGGGLLGNAIEKHERENTVYDVHVRMSDGNLRTVRQSTAPVVGSKVLVDANGLHDRG